MLKCPNCGSEVRESARFCLVCGHPLQAPPRAASASKQSKFKGWVNAVGKGWLILFGVLLVIVLPSCFILGFYTNRILWMLGLR